MAIFIDGFEIDVAIQEDHSFDSTITSDPVEQGTPSSDNIRNLPKEVTITGIVSDNPLEGVESRRPVLADNDTYTKLAYDFLLEVRRRREPVTIETSLGIHTSMGLQNLSVPRNSGTGAALRFTATFKQLSIRTNKRAVVRVLLPRAKPKKKIGAVQPPDAAGGTSLTPKDADWWTGKELESTISGWR